IDDVKAEGASEGLVADRDGDQALALEQIEALMDRQRQIAEKGGELEAGPRPVGQKIFPLGEPISDVAERESVPMTPVPVREGEAQGRVRGGGAARVPVRQGEIGGDAAGEPEEVPV